jgi:hydroxyethylthiazole kinase-like uncharacterized protein yjeF
MNLSFMKILSAEQIRAWDLATMKRQGISSFELMERAATAIADWVVAHFNAQTPFIILCGTGNNGGDGLALTRLLLERGYGVRAFVVKHTSGYSPDCGANLERLVALDPDAVGILADGEFITELPKEIVVIDAIFGTGINRPLDGYVADFIKHINAIGNRIIAIDLPSGMDSDEPLPEGAMMIRAQDTLCLQQFKRAMLHPESGAACGEVHLLDIALDRDFQEGIATHWQTLSPAFLKTRYRPRKAFTNKGSHGTAHLIGGSHGLIGAIVLAGRSAGRAGAGKVRLLIPECGYTVAQTLAPETMCATSGTDFLSDFHGWEESRGIGIGPGLGKADSSLDAFKTFLKKIDRPIVVDADALNLLGVHPELMKDLPPRSILTPHPKELERLFGKVPDSFARAEQAREQAMAHEITIVAKDRFTLIALPDGRCYYNTAGNAGLATGGAGDVLLGVITGLLAQGYEPEDAAMLGVFLHATAADRALAEESKESLIAPDLERFLGAAFKELE